MKQWIILLMFILLANITYACQTQYLTYQDVIILDTIIEDGINADCNITVYLDNTSIYELGVMTKTGRLYNYTILGLENGQYITHIYCNKTGGYGPFESDCTFKIEGEDNMYLTIAIIMIGIVAFFIFIGFKIELPYFDFVIGRDKQVLKLPWLQYLFILFAGWGLIAAANVMVVADSINNLGLINTIGSFYKMVLWAMYILTAFWIIGVVFYIFQWLGGLGKELKV